MTHESKRLRAGAKPWKRKKEHWRVVCYSCETVDKNETREGMSASVEHKYHLVSLVSHLRSTALAHAHMGAFINSTVY